MDAKTPSTPPQTRPHRPTWGWLSAFGLTLVLALAGALAGCGGSSGGTTPTNQVPTAVIGTVSALYKGGTETLNGSGSSDPEGEALTYSWTVSAGSLSSATAVNPTFTAPYAVSTVTVTLTVNDGTQNSTAATATISVSDHTPVAQIAAADQAATSSTFADSGYDQGETIYLDGSRSSDADSRDVLTYTWGTPSCTGGSTINLSNKHSARPYFVVPSPATSPDTCTVSLTVSDGVATDTTSQSFNIYSYAGTANTGYSTNPFRNIVSSLSPKGMAWPSNGNLYVTNGSANQLLIYAGLNNTPPSALYNDATSDVAMPTATAFTTDDAAYAVAVKSTTAYVAIGTHGLEIVSLGTPARAGETTTTSESTGGSGFQGIATDVALYTQSITTYALLVDVTNGGRLLAYDVTNPAAIKLMAAVSVSGATAVTVDQSNGVAYVAHTGGVTAYSLASLSSLSMPSVGSISIAAPLGVYVWSGHLYVAAGTDGLLVYSTSNLSQVTSYTTPGKANSVYLDSNSYAYVTDTSGLYVLNAQNPTSLFLLGNYVVPDAAHVVADGRNYVAYVAGGGELDAINVALPTQSSLQHTQSVSGGVVGMAALGNRLYYNNLTVDDISNPYSPSQVDSYSSSLGGAGRKIVFSGDYLYEASDGGLEIVDIHTQGRLGAAGTLSSVAPANALVLTSDAKTAIVAGSSGLSRVDVSTLSSPALSGSTNTQLGSLQSLAISSDDKYVIAASSDTSAGGLDSYDVSASGTPTYGHQYGNKSAAYGVALAADGQHAYLARLSQGLDVVDTSSLPAMTQTGTTITSFFNGDAVTRVATVGNYVVLATHPADGTYPFNNGIVILDASTPTAPTLAGEYEIPTSGTRAIAVEGNQIYLATELGYDVAQLAPTFTRITNPGSSTTSESYTVAFTPPSTMTASGNIYVQCTVTAGTCTAGTFNTTTNASTVSWTGLSSGTTAQIRFTVGNQHFFTTAIDNVTVQ